MEWRVKKIVQTEYNYSIIRKAVDKAFANNTEIQEKLLAKNPKQPTLSFSKETTAFTSAFIDGKEYVPREWYDKASQAFFEK